MTDDRFIRRVDAHWSLSGRTGTSCWASGELARHYAAWVDREDGRWGVQRTWTYKPCDHIAAERS